MPRFFDARLVTRYASDYFQEYAWERGYEQILDRTIDLCGNEGQRTIIKDYWIPSASNYCRDANDEYDEISFLEYVRFDIGDRYFDAVSIISEIMAEELGAYNAVCFSYDENIPLSLF